MIHAYGVPSQKLLLVTGAGTEMEAIYRAGLDAKEAIAAMEPGDDGVCLVAYDGDSGERMDWNV